VEIENEDSMALLEEKLLLEPDINSTLNKEDLDEISSFYD
jgi:hypothetical protein